MYDKDGYHENGKDVGVLAPDGRWVEHVDPTTLNYYPAFRPFFEQHRQHGGKRFTVIGAGPRTDEPDEPLIRIRIETGEEIEAWAHEVSPDYKVCEAQIP